MQADERMVLEQNIRANMLAAGYSEQDINEEIAIATTDIDTYSDLAWLGGVLTLVFLVVVGGVGAYAIWWA